MILLTGNTVGGSKNASLADELLKERFLECEKFNPSIIVRGHEANITFCGVESGWNGSCHSRHSLSPSRLDYNGSAEVTHRTVAKVKRHAGTNLTCDLLCGIGRVLISISDAGRNSLFRTKYCSA